MAISRPPMPLTQRPKVVIVSNIPAPYRIPVFDALPEASGVELHCVYLSRREPDRDWNIPTHAESVHVHYPASRLLTVGDKFIHFTTSLTRLLRKIDPDVVITSGFAQPYLEAFAYAWRRGIAHIPTTDGTFDSEQVLSGLHRLLRRLVFARSAAFLGASEGSWHLYASYGIPHSRFFQMHLCADMARFARSQDTPVERDADLVFSGRMHPAKNPLFTLDVAAEVARQIGRRISLLMLGSGPLMAQIRARAAELAEHVDVKLPGFLDQADLPAAYRRGKVFLFPTARDVWGVVANEACAAGLPVLITPEAGAAGELIVDGCNGHVLPLSLDLWVSRSTRLLTDATLWQTMSTDAQARVGTYTYANAARGLSQAVDLALGRPRLEAKPEGQSRQSPPAT